MYNQFCFEQLIIEAFNRFKSNWENNTDNFAFAAFYKNIMIGFILGNSNFIRDLFVLPEYSRKGVGNKLLRYAEKINYNYKTDIQLKALSKSIVFYTKNGYKKQNDTNIFIKNLELQVDEYYTIPLFNAYYTLKHIHNTNITESSEYNPYFACVKNKNIIGYANIDNNTIKYKIFDIQNKLKISSELYNIIKEYKYNVCALNLTKQI